MTKAYAFRLMPGDDLKLAIDSYVNCNNLHAAFVFTCVGSLVTASLRMANEEKISEIKGPFEIVSLVGTLSADSGSHLHIALSDGKGNCIGGHLLAGSIIHTTAEVVLGEIPGIKFLREPCTKSGYAELVVKGDL